MLLMIEKDIRGGICHSIHRYARSKNKYIKNYNTDIELLYWGANSFYGWAMSQNYLQMVLNGKKMSKISEDSDMMKIVIKDR